MSWKNVAPRTLFRRPSTIRFRYSVEKGKERVMVRIGSEALKAIKADLGDQVEILFDDENLLFGFRKTTSENGRRLTGKNASAIVSFPRPNGKAGKAIAALCDREIEPQVQKGILVIDCRECFQ